MARARGPDPSASRRSRGAGVEFSFPWKDFVRGGVVPRREIPINPGQPEAYRYQLNVCVFTADGSRSYRRVEYDSPIQIRPETIRRIVEITLNETGRGTYRHGRRVDPGPFNEDCGVTVEGITRKD